jgi:hypothetical protein
MATIAWAVLTTPFDGSGSQLVRWVLTANDVGAPYRAPLHADKTVQALGTFGGTITIEGTLEPDDPPASWETLNDNRGQGNAITFTAKGMRCINENVYQIRPTAGAGVTSVTVLLMIGSSR